LQINGALPRRSCWSESIKDLERSMSEWYFVSFWRISYSIASYCGMDKPTILKGQTPIQTKYGALYYETPYRGESICLLCDGSCGYIHGTKHELPCQDDRTEQTK
jgi:hypothetical protein